MFLRILLQSLSNCCGVKTYLIYYCLHIKFFAHILVLFQLINSTGNSYGFLVFIGMKHLSLDFASIMSW